MSLIEKSVIHGYISCDVTPLSVRVEGGGGVEGKSRLSFNFDEDGVGFLPGLIRSERGESTFEKGGGGGEWLFGLLISTGRSRGESRNLFKNSSPFVVISFYFICRSTRFPSFPFNVPPSVRLEINGHRNRSKLTNFISTTPINPGLIKPRVNFEENCAG